MTESVEEKTEEEVSQEWLAENGFKNVTEVKAAIAFMRRSNLANHFRLTRKNNKGVPIGTSPAISRRERLKRNRKAKQARLSRTGSNARPKTTTWDNPA